MFVLGSLASPAFSSNLEQQGQRATGSEAALAMMIDVLLLFLFFAWCMLWHMIGTSGFSCEEVPASLRHVSSSM